VQHPDSSSLLLCIETSGSLCGIALANTATQHTDSSTLLAELSFSEPFLHDKLLAEAAHSLCAMVDVEIGSLAAVAVSAGPGSFTGLRIGAAFAKALTFENVPKLIAVPTLEAIALSAAPSAELLSKQRICVGIPSHKNLVYWQEFESSVVPINTVTLVEANTLVPNKDFFYAGPAFTSMDFSESAYTTLPEFCRISPSMIANLAVRLFHQQVFTLSEEFVPLYVQDFIPKTVKRR
jgi:tRNA threonylcarbamoyladenosine biosynthesis protein TsaB